DETINLLPFGNIFAIQHTVTDLCQTVYRVPTVVNFFEPNYQTNGDSGLAGLFAPEMQIITETTAMNSANYIYTGVYTGWAGPNGNDVKLNLITEQNMATNVPQLVESLNQLLLGGQMPTTMRTTVTNYVNILPST